MMMIIIESQYVRQVTKVARELFEQNEGNLIDALALGMELCQVR